MQDQYTGDIGDYGKLGLLRCLHAAGLSIGVNWYLTPSEHNGDGEYTQYLDDETFKGCDEPLWNALKQIVDTKREVAALENDQILPAVFYSAILDYTGKSRQERMAFRMQWHSDAVSALAGTDIVFCDPDNGLIVPSAMNTARDNKYVLPEELAAYYQNGSSVIYYQHKARRTNDFYIDQHEKLLADGAFQDASALSLKFKTTSLRYYFMILHPQHQEAATAAVNHMLTTDWKVHFRRL